MFRKNTTQPGDFPDELSVTDRMAFDNGMRELFSQGGTVFGEKPSARTTGVQSAVRRKFSKLYGPQIGRTAEELEALLTREGLADPEAEVLTEDERNQVVSTLPHHIHRRLTREGGIDSLSPEAEWVISDDIHDLNPDL